VTLPRSAIFRRSSFRASGSGSNFSPYTQYFEMSHPDLRDWLLRDRSAPGSRADVSDLQSIIHHELAHWIQNHGTSIPTLLSALRAQQLDLFLLGPRLLGAPAIGALIARRFGGRKNSMLKLGQSGLARDVLAKANPNWAHFRAHWWDLHLTQKVFESPEALLPLDSSISQSLRKTFAGLVQAPQPRDLRSSGTAVSSHEEHTIRRLLSNDVTLRTLLEGFASANQLVYYTLVKEVDKSPWVQSRISSTIRSVAETDYGKAIRRFAERCPEIKKDMLRGFLTFCAIVDLSLHPSFDAICERSQGGGRLDDVFADVYPASRFEKLCAAAKGMTPIRLDSSDAQILALQQDLLHRSGLKCAALLELRMPRIDSLTSLEFKASTLSTYTIGDVEAYLQRACAAARREHPSLFILPSAQYIYRRPWLSELIRDDSLGSVVRPPLWSDRKHHVYFGLSHSASHCLIFWSIFATVAHDLLCGHGRLDLSMYPEDVIHSGIAEDAIGAAFHHYGFDWAVREVDSLATYQSR
jgi:hypothetical protein